MMELYLLEQLIAFSRQGTLSGAAEKLHISQPALSQSMKKLEESLGVSFLIRSFPNCLTLFTEWNIPATREPAGAAWDYTLLKPFWSNIKRNTV